MGFLEDMAGKVMGGTPGGGQSNNLVSSVIGMINNQQGGLSGLVQAFESKGLGGVVSSWVGTGQNQEISGDQLQSVLGSGAVQEIAQKVGLPEGAVTQQLTALLPGIVDHLTPNGQIPQGLETIGMDLLKGFISKGAGA